MTWTTGFATSLILITNIALLLQKDTTLVHWSPTSSLSSPRCICLSLKEPILQAESVVGELHSNCTCILRINVEHVDDVLPHTYTHTHIAKYSDFLVYTIYVGLTSARPNYMYCDWSVLHHSSIVHWWNYCGLGSSVLVVLWTCFLLYMNALMENSLSDIKCCYHNNIIQKTIIVHVN